MIDHQQARELLSLDLDGELGSALAPDLHEHLGTCPSCAAHAARLARVRGALRDESEPSPDISAGVLAAIGRSSSFEERSSSASPFVASNGEVELQVVGHHVEHPSTAGSPASVGGETTVVERAGWSRGSRLAARWLPAAACLVVGLLIGSALVGGWQTRSTPAAAQVPERIAAAQFAVASLSARIEITERGWNEQVPVRTFRGAITFGAPDLLALHLVDDTGYPSGEWVANDVDAVLRDRTWWARGPRDCPSGAQPGCTAPEPRLEVVDNLGAHDDATAVPLDLVVPVRSFLRSGEPPALGTRTIDGHEAIGVEVSAAQLAPLLDGLRPAGNLRQFFPSDIVALWLDAESWTPRRIEVRAAADPDRRTWATNRGYVDRPGDEILTVDVLDQRINGGVDDTLLVPTPEGGVRRDAGTVELVDGVTVPGYVRTDLRGVEVDPSALPAGLTPSTTGITGFGSERQTVVQTWDGGRGWVKVSSTSDWDGTRLFGDLGSPVRRLTAPDGSVTYASLDGSRHAIHADDLDIVVTGSVDDDVLARVVAGIAVRGVAVPADWDDAATETVESAAGLLPGLLVVRPGGGFEDAAVRADGNVVTQAHAGAGSRGFVLVEAPGERLAPPLDMDVAGVVVRGVEGRYSATRGELEWVEGDRVHQITSVTLTRSELVAIADALGPA